MKITIGKKLTISTVVNLSLLAIVSIVACLASLRITSSTDTLISLLRKMEVVDRLQFAVVESIKMNDFLISGDLEKKTAFELSSLGVEGVIGDVEQLDLDLTERANLVEIKRQFNLLNKTTHQICDEAVTSDNDFLSESINSLVEDADEIAVFIVEASESIHDSLNTKIADAKLKNEHAKQLSLIMTVSVSILAVFLGIGGSIILARNITKPIEALASSAKFIAEGDFGKRVDVTSHDEIGQLAIAFNNMSAAINGKTNELIEANMNLQEVHKELLLASRRAGMAEVATDVLHNVGNVLNSVNVSTIVIGEMLSDSKVPNLKKVTDIIDDHAQDMGSFLTEDPQGKHIPAYLRKIAKSLTDEQAKIAEEVKALAENVKHIKEIVKMQQSYSKAAGVKVVTSLAEIIENAIQINNAGLKRHGITFMTEFAELPEVNIDKQRVLQIIVNLISNAKYAASKNQQNEKLLTIRSYRHDEDRLRIEVADNGIGISEENLSKIFSHGFTTKEDGHGFGLHSGALAAKEIGGSLTVYSDGPGQGATFVLELPFEPVGVSV